MGSKKKRTPAKTTTAKKSTVKKSTAKKSTAKKTMAMRRADYGKPVEGFFAKQTGEIRAILDALRNLVDEAAPDALASLKWGMPFFTVGTEMMCALTAHKSHVNLVLTGLPGTYADPGGLLIGEGKTGRHLKLEKVADLPTKAVRGWLRTAATRARAAT
jgi:hypothetical protein